MNKARQNPARRPWRALALVVAIAALGGTLVVSSLRTVQVECELCVEFRGQRQCRTGSGATREDAMSAAQRAACAPMAFGMDQDIACSNTVPRQVQCTG